MRSAGPAAVDVVVTLAGYFLGNVGFVKDHLELVILLIVVLSVLPMGVEYLRHRRQRGMSREETAEESADVVEAVEDADRS